MRLTTSDYRHPAELPTFVASAWLAVVLLAIAEALMVWLVVARPLYAPASLALGIVLLVAFHLGLVWGVVGIRRHRDGLHSAGRRAGPSRHQRVHDALEAASERLSTPGTPPVYVIPVDEIDSFTIAWGVPEIYVTEGMVRALGDLELRAALAHELGHLKSDHARWLTLVRLPISAGLAPRLLLAPFALAWLALRWWAGVAGVAELTADRAAAIAVGGPEPVVRWLSAAMAPGSGAIGESGLHRYLTHAGDEPAWEAAQEELHAIEPRLARRVVTLARFTASAKFTSCLAIIGDLDIPVIEERPDPESAGVLPQTMIGLLAGLSLTPIAIALAIVVIGTPGPTPTQATRPAVERFNPETAPDAEDAQNPADGIDAPATAPRTPAGSFSGPNAVEGMLELARRHKDREEYDKAVRVLQDLIEIDLQNAEAHHLLAWTWIEMGERENALQEFRATANLTEPGDELHEQAVAALERME